MPIDEPPDFYAPPGQPSRSHEPPVGAIRPQVGESFAKRGSARLIDWIFGVFVGAAGGVVGGFAFALVNGEAALLERAKEDSFVLRTLLGLPGPILYHMLAEGLGGATVGKAVLGMRVVRANGTPCTLLAALGRELAFFVDALFFGMVAYSFMSRDALRQRLGDRWADTVVVPVDHVPPAAVRGVAGPLVLSITAWGFFAAVMTFLA